MSATTTVLVDAGIDPQGNLPLDGFDRLQSPVDALSALGVADTDVDYLLLSHLHYDHTGCARRFTTARSVVQQSELDYWRGPAAARITREAWLHHAPDVDYLQQANDERVVIADGDQQVVPGVIVHRVGGHTAGLQVVSVQTASGAVVLASDACHFYENLHADRPGPVVHDTPRAYTAFDRVRQLAGPDGVVIPGHDPQVLDRFPRIDGSSVARLDVTLQATAMRSIG
jgi:glyoxylase-like metal-dependent hydrolase (beta-lactamase superfamily II)